MDQSSNSPHTGLSPTEPSREAFVVVLGTVQDGGYPQPGCTRACCTPCRGTPVRHVASLGIVDADRSQRWIIDCTPDFPRQLELLGPVHSGQQKQLDGILLTHAHIGHYAGLIHFGREVMNTHRVPVLAMPRMVEFLKTNDPWRQLVSHENIHLRTLADRDAVWLNERICITPNAVPHRNELSETVGFVVSGTSQRILYIPDIDAWDPLEPPIEQLLDDVNVAFLDGTFFDSGELPHRDMSTIPHPTIVDSIRRFDQLPRKTRERIRFIHLNHTNPALQAGTPARRQILVEGYQVAHEGDRVSI